MPLLVSAYITRVATIAFKLTLACYHTLFMQVVKALCDRQADAEWVRPRSIFSIFCLACFFLLGNVRMTMFHTHTHTHTHIHTHGQSLAAFNLVPLLTHMCRVFAEPLFITGIHLSHLPFTHTITVKSV